MNPAPRPRAIVRVDVRTPPRATIRPRPDGRRAAVQPRVTVTSRADGDVERWVPLVEALMAVRLPASS
jgi:hypothetical protein